MPKCWLYDAIDKKGAINCINCEHWDSNVQKCKGEELLKEAYEESGAFKAYDCMMRSNRGVCDAG